MSRRRRILIPSVGRMDVDGECDGESGEVLGVPEDKLAPWTSVILHL